MANHSIVAIQTASPRGEATSMVTSAAGYPFVGPPHTSPHSEARAIVQTSSTTVLKTLGAAHAHPLQGTPRQSASSFPSPAPSCRIVPGYPVTFNFSTASVTPTGSVTSLNTMRQISGPELSISPPSSLTDLQRAGNASSVTVNVAVPETLPMCLPLSVKDRVLTPSVAEGYKDDLASMDSPLEERGFEHEVAEMVELASNAPAGEKGSTSDVLSTRLDDQETTVCSSGNSLTASSPRSRLRGSSTCSVWTYPARKHSAPTPQRVARPSCTSPRSRLQGDTMSRVAAAARRRKLLEQALEDDTLEPAEDDDGSQTTQSVKIGGRSLSKCFEDLYVDAMERHRRYQVRVAKLLEQEDAEVKEAMHRARQEYMVNQMRVPGRPGPRSPRLGFPRLDMISEESATKEKHQASGARQRSLSSEVTVHSGTVVASAPRSKSAGRTKTDNKGGGTGETPRRWHSELGEISIASSAARM